MKSPNKLVSFFLYCIVVSILVGCGQDPIPKPNAMLRLEYPEPQYQTTTTDLPFTFEKNLLADSISGVKISNNGASNGIDIVYPSLKGTIYLTYKEVKNPDMLRTYLIDAQKITLKHTQIADEIEGELYENKDHRVFGMFYEIGGNAASQSQFYLTDSTNHFLNGSLYFYTKPNYDSILPAANYLINDIKAIMETVRWKN